MSELEDKPGPKPKAEDAKRAGVESSTSQLDAGWDDLLESASSASNQPIFAPPGAKQAKVLATADAAPRTSQASASVSGEFQVVERPEPPTPPRYEPPEGLTEEEEVEEEVALTVPEPRLVAIGLVTQDDDDRETPEELVAVSSDPRQRPSEDLESEPDEGSPSPPPAANEKPRARPPEPADSEPEPEPSGGARKLGYIVGAIAIISIIAIAVLDNDADRERTEPTASKQVVEPPTKPPAEQPEPRPRDLATPGTETGAGETGGETGEGETGGEAELEPKPKPPVSNPRDPSLIPPGTPEENAKAFAKLPVSIHDGPPIGGIGRSGVHVDAIATARGRDNTDCSDPTQTFSVSAAEYVNVCFRVVHPREQEWLRVIWEKDGKVTRRGRVRIPDLHAYTTRAYLLVRPEYEGRWRVRIVPEGEETTDLALAEFEITK